jgi:hypothetical protein
MVGSALVGPTLVIVPTVIRARLFAASLKRHGFTVAVLPDEWPSAAGGVDVVIGSRTAVFARVPDLRSIVVIDEHDDSLREERTPTWHARDIAIERAQQTSLRHSLNGQVFNSLTERWTNVGRTRCFLQTSLPNCAIMRDASSSFSIRKDVHACWHVPHANLWLDVQVVMPQLKLVLWVNFRARDVLLSVLRCA